MHGSLHTPPPIFVFQRNGWGLIPNLQHVIVMLSLQQKGKFDLGTFCLDDALHLFGRIPNWHIATSGTRSAARRRVTNMNQEVSGRTLIAQPTKVRWERDAIERLCHALFIVIWRWYLWRKTHVPKAQNLRLIFSKQGVTSPSVPAYLD